MSLLTAIFLTYTGFRGAVQNETVGTKNETIGTKNETVGTKNETVGTNIETKQILIITIITNSIITRTYTRQHRLRAVGQLAGAVMWEGKGVAVYMTSVPGDWA